jgi:hypothetical protein
MKRSKGFIAQLIVAITLSITFIGLGNWQLDRAHDVKVAKRSVSDSPRVALESIASVTSNLSFKGTLKSTRIIAFLSLKLKSCNVFIMNVFSTKILISLRYMKWIS